MTNSTALTYVELAGLQVHNALQEFVADELLPGTGLDEDDFWQNFAALIGEFQPRNQALLRTRDDLQAQLDQWHKAHRNALDFTAYKSFLQAIGYLVDEGPDFAITTANVDAEIALQAGPQLVVPVMNARFALNACNARWGSLYDALYGTDVIPETDGAGKLASYNPVRGAKVVAYGRAFLSRHFPLKQGDFTDLCGFKVKQQKLLVQLASGATELAEPGQWLGYRGQADAPEAIVLVHHGLHVEIQLDRNHAIGATDRAGIKDIVLEAALTTIMDCEDSVAAVDASDKVLVYRNWLGLMLGDLEEKVSKNGNSFVRTMAAERSFVSPDGVAFELPGRSLMFVRNVGHLMTTPAVKTANGEEIPEGILDAMITTVAAIHDLKGNGLYQNSREGSIYIVKPKMHGPQEVAFTNDLFARIEVFTGLQPNTLKIGIMDEERRTSVNLKECIRAAKARVVFINTGFLDRTGDEIHTSMEAGAFAPKDVIKTMPWIAAYEKNNVAVGLACGFKGRAQIGKGMWAMPENMAAMMQAKIAQPQAGANTAWVPSPTAAVLHAMHYHEVDVVSVQQTLAAQPREALIDAILAIPLLQQPLPAEAIQRELENNCQGILGYVVRWVDQGIGCSKVPDIQNTALMEDRATLRISSQHICNWLHHGICTEEQVLAVLEAMAQVVDQQNVNDRKYRAMSRDLQHNLAFAAARDLICKGRTQPNGYTEPLLHQYRLALKSA